MTFQATRTRLIKDIATRHGFLGAGISRAEFLEEETKNLEVWLNKGYHGEMSYMANHFDLRTDPTKLVPGAKSVISLLYNYYPGDLPAQEDGFKISRYARGEDYHKVIRKKLKLLVSELKNEIGDFHARVFVDSAPVMERDWAKRSGQGWIGKNTLLINPKKGSYFFLAEIILDVELEYDHPMRDHCGTCTRCIEACPTEAISPTGYVLDGSKCISYLTIELKENIPESFNDKFQDWIFGCDICQEVCPWNRFAQPHSEEAFMGNAEVHQMKRSEWMELTEEIFHRHFEKSPLKRAGYQKLSDTVKFISKKNHDQ